MRLVCLADTHGFHDAIDVPDGDVLVHAGDFTGHGTEAQVRAFGEWLARQPHRAKVVVAGNHDFLFQDKPELARELLGDVVYLQDAGAEVLGLRFWGAPWQPWFFDWAFNLPRGQALAEKWALMPNELDVLVTHGPPMDVLDLTEGGDHVGCEELALAVERIQPKAHVFGHIHEAYGQQEAFGGMAFNAAICDRRYRLAHPPVVVDL